MPPLGINCLDSFLNFRNRKKPKSSKQKIPAFFIWTKLSLFLLSISHSSRFPFLLTPTPLTSSHSPLSFAPPHPIFSHTPFSLFQYTPFFLSFLQHLSLLPILHFPLLHLIPFSPTPLFLYSNTPHFSFPLLQLTPLPLIFYFPFLQHLSLLLILHFPLLHLIPFSPTSLFLYSNTPHSSSFPFPIFQHLPPSLFHPMFSFLQNQTTLAAQKIPLLQNPKPENPLVLSQCSTPFAEPSSSFPLQKK